jgi:hypothetical protein
MMVRRKATEDEEAFHREVMAEITKAARRHPGMSDLHIVAVLGRSLGYCLWLIGDNLRETARRVAITNMEKGEAQAPDIARGQRTPE